MSSDELAPFIASSFRSVWALELLILLKHEDRACTTDEQVTLMRASPAVVDSALQTLVAAGLADKAGKTVRYMPVNDDVASLVEQTERFYRSRPDRVRRMIVASSNKGLTAFSDALRLTD